MSYIFKKGATSQSIELYIVDSTDGTPETGVLWNTAGIDLKYRRKDAAVVSITEAALSTPLLTDTWETGGFLEIGNGSYRLDLPDAALLSASGIDRVTVFGTVTGMVVLPVTIHLTDIDLNDAVRGGMTALPDAAADAAGGLPISDAGGLDLDAMKEDMLVHETTIAVVTNDKTFTLTASGLDGDSSADDDAFNNASVVIEDVTGTARELRTVEDYAGVAKQIILDRNCKFNLAAGDKVRFYPSCTSNVVAAVVTDADKDDIVDKVWDEADADHMTAGTKGLKVHHAGRGRY